MKNRNRITYLFAAAISMFAFARSAIADVQPISFDMGADNVFTVADATAQGMLDTPSQYGTLGRFSTSTLLCLGPSNSTAGTGNPIGLFNVDPNGNFSTPMTFSSGFFLDATAGATGWGVISGNIANKGLSNGTYNLGFRTSTGNFGWMNVTLNENGTPKTVNNDVITINAAYVETVVGQGISVGAVPEPISAFPISLLCVGLAAWSSRHRRRATRVEKPAEELSIP